MLLPGEFLDASLFGRRLAAGHEISVAEIHTDASERVEVWLDGRLCGVIPRTGAYGFRCTWDENRFVIWAATTIALLEPGVSQFYVTHVREPVQRVYLVGAHTYTVHDTYVAELEFLCGSERIIVDNDEIFIDSALIKGTIVLTDLAGRAFRIATDLSVGVE